MQPVACARLAASFALLTLGVGCGEALRLSMPSGYASVGFTGGGGRPIAILSPFEDNRKKPACPRGPEDIDAEDSVYTSLHNRLGCSSAPPEWIAKRVGLALESAGFDVVTRTPQTALDPGARSDAITVEGRLDMLEVEVLSQMQTAFAEADLQVEIFVSTPDGLRASRRFHTKSRDVGLVVGSKTNQRVFDDTADRAARDITAAILSLLNRYAATGSEIQTVEGGP